LTETSFKWFSFSIIFIFLPFFGCSVEIIISPKFLHHFFFIDIEFSGINLSKSSQSESPTFFSWTKGNITYWWIKHKISHFWLFITRNNNIDHINNSNKVLIHTLGVILQFKNLSINFVNHKNWSNFFCHTLT